MKLLLLDQFSDLGGAQQVLLELLPAFQARGWQALVGLPGDGELVRCVRALGVETESIDCGPYASGRKSAADVARFAVDTPQLARQIRRLASDADLVYVNGPRLLPAAALAGVDRRVVFHAHSYVAPGAIRRLAGAALRRMRGRVIAACAFVGEPWKGLAPVTVIYNGVSGPAAPLDRAPAASPRIGCLGRIAPEKGQMDFVAAAAIIHRAVPGAHFVVYGAPLFNQNAAYESAVRQAAAKLPIEFAGWTGDVYDAMAGLNLLLVPSSPIEATTRVILEAFAAGLPVVAFRSGGIPEVIDHGVNGILAGSTEEMARESVRLLTAPEIRLAISRAARETWQRRFTLTRFHDEIARTLSSISDSPRNP
ncbi:MAG TPA: glycosyltransferase family 4 protein [Candidatus Acidoferrales bacterium]|nr:glycosyltransferase family 4 protein [Candidatus Acidoferrales bacterium]